jgi:hypothetical protein
MLFALGATSSIWDALQSLRAQSGTTSQTTASSFEPTSDVAPPESTATACSSGSCSSPLSSQTLGALIAAHSSSVAGGTGSSAPSGSVGGSADTGVSGTDPQGQIAPGSTTTVTNADGSTTTSFTLADGAKITLVTPGPRITSDALPSSLATSSYNLVEQAIQRDAQSLSANASAYLSVNV